MEDFEDIQCPCCAETMPVEIDRSAGQRQDFFVDCENCCRPIRILIEVDADGGVQIDARSETAE